jgi:chemotaxis protein histidine kinase CheA
MIDQLSELSEEQLAELQTSIVNEFETVEKEDPTPQTVDAMTSLADMLDTVRGEIKGRAAAAEELTARAAEAAMRVKGEEDAPAEAPEGDMPMEAPAKTEEKPEEAPEEEKKEMPMAASTSVEEASELSTSVEPTETTEATEPAAELSATEEVAATETETVAEAAVEEVSTEAAVEATPQAELSTEPTEPAEAEVVAETPAEEAVVAAAEVEDSTETIETTEAPTAQEDQEAPVTAAANEPDALIEAPADRRPVAQASVAPVAITAGADIPGYTAGSAITDMSEVAQAMSKRLHTLRRVNGGDGEQHIVASITTQYPEDRTLSTDAESNWNKIQKVVGPEALVASGGHQAPFEVKYDIFGLGSAVRPVRDCLPRFQADRGGIRYIVPPVLSDYANAVGIWTAANDSAETPSPAAKLSLTVTAASETTVATDAVTLQLQFGNLLTRAYPELIARHNELGLIQHAREAEGQILTRMDALSTAVTSTSIIGVARDFLVQIGRAAAAYRSRHRLEADAPLRAIMPAWIKDAMVADLTLSMPGDSTLNAYGEIDGLFASRNINVCYTLDGSALTTSQGANAMNEFTDTFVWYLFAEGTFLFLDGGTLDLGIIRDSTLVGTNDYKMFVETFEGVAKVGVESLKVTSTISVNGAAAALRDTLGGVTAAVIEY